jgi:Lon protease-like protein
MHLPCEVPVMTLPNAILFPGALLPLYIFEPRYRRMLAASLESHRLFAVAMQKPGRQRETPCNVAGIGLIRVAVTRKDGTSYLVLQGLLRAELSETVRYRPFRIQRFRPLSDTDAESGQLPGLTERLRGLVQQKLQQGAFKPVTDSELIMAVEGTEQLNSLAAFSLQHFLQYLTQLKDPGQMADLVSCTMLSGASDRQTILETVNLEDRLKRVIHFLMVESTSSGIK